MSVRGVSKLQSDIQHNQGWGSLKVYITPQNSLTSLTRFKVVSDKRILGNPVNAINQILA